MSDQQQALNEQLERARQELSARQSFLDTAEREAEALSAEHQRTLPVEEVCAALEKLAEQGVADLFWHGALASVDPDTHLRQVRHRLGDAVAAVRRAEERSVSAAKAVDEQLDAVLLLEDELYELQQEEESRLREWIVEREPGPPPERHQVMPWMRGQEEDRLFRRHLARSLAAALLLGLLIPLIDLPIPELDQPIEVPDRLVRFINQEPEPVPPAQIAQQEIPDETQPEPEPEAEPEAESPPQAEQQVAETAPAEPQPAAKPKPKGILAFRDSISSIARSRPAAQLGSAARISNAGEAATGMPERAMVTAQGEGSSGGINLAALSRDVGGGGQGIEGVEAGRVASTIDAGGGGVDRPRSAGASAGRTDEEIQIVFDRYKAALYRLYNRELRRDPTLRGQIVLRLTIEPDGSVSLCRLQSSDMHAPELVEQVVARVSGFDFGPKEVPPVTILYPIDFLPTA